MAAGAAVALGLAAAGVGFTAVSKAVALSRLDRLERRNALLAEELTRAERAVSSVRDSVAEIMARDNFIRLLAGLAPTDPEVQQAGIGGPVGGWTEREHILSEGPAGQRALDMRAEVASLIRRANLLAGSFDEARRRLESNVDRLQRTPSIVPTAGWRTSTFTDQRLHPIFHIELPHEGLDFAAAIGTPVLAPALGVVRRVFNNGGYGLMVEVDHGRGVVTRYGHLARALVRQGQQVRRGDKIAEVGDSGIATAPHLHYEVLLHGVPQDPTKFIILPLIVPD